MRCSGLPGQVRGLPAGIALSDLQSEKVEAIPATQDGNPDMTSEFFDTRQVTILLLLQYS